MQKLFTDSFKLTVFKLHQSKGYRKQCHCSQTGWQDCATICQNCTTCLASRLLSIMVLGPIKSVRRCPRSFLSHPHILSIYFADQKDGIPISNELRYPLPCYFHLFAKHYRTELEVSVTMYHSSFFKIFLPSKSFCQSGDPRITLGIYSLPVDNEWEC